MTLTVTADIPKARTPGKDEKPEDKTRLDKEFKDKQQKLEDRLAQDKTYEKRIYLVSSWSVDSLLKDRSQLLEEKKEEPKKEPTTPAPQASPDPRSAHACQTQTGRHISRFFREVAIGRNGRARPPSAGPATEDGSLRARRLFGVHPLGCWRAPNTLKGGHQTAAARAERPVLRSSHCGGWTRPTNDSRMRLSEPGTSSQQPELRYKGWAIPSTD